MFARLNFFKVTLRSMWEDYSDFVSNFRDDLEEPYILPNIERFSKMCKTGSLGDYLGLPTFGNRTINTVTLTDKPCAAGKRNFTGLSLGKAMSAIRDGKRVDGLACTASLNSDGTQTILFECASSSTPIPADVSQVGVDVTLTGGESSVFDGARGYFVFRDDGAVS